MGEPDIWEAHGPDDFGDFNISRKGEKLAKCVVVQNGFRTPEETAAIATRLIKSVNSHDALVKALRPFIEALPGHEHAKLIDKRYGDFNPIQATVTKAQMQAAREALAKVQS